MSQVARKAPGIASISVAFDSAAFARPQHGGIARYFSALVRELNLIDGVEATIYAPLYRNEYARRLSEGTIRGVYVPTLPKTGLIVDRLSAMLCDFAFRGPQSEIIHETGYRAAPAKLRGRNRIVTIHEMMPELFSFSAGQEARRAAVQRADHVICVSETTRRDLIEIFGVNPARTSVTYLGVDKHMQQKTSIPQDQRLKRPYILFVAGGRGRYKNFRAFVEAFASSSKLRHDFDVICFGGGGFDGEEREWIDALKLAPTQIRQLGGSDEKLKELYAGARAFVYPSLYEGFGLPPLEAMWMDCPVAASNAGAIPEVVGSAAKLFDPCDLDAMRLAIEDVVFDESLRQKLIGEGRLRREQFTWERCARDTLSVYRGIASRVGN
jgi:glycosyltransferase involved in cell wall biosynthesis